MYKRFIQGFTMVELMIVIAIIGIIAVAVLSAINPVEQINKGKDTRTRADAGELLNAMERMYATDEKYPFFDGTVAWAAGRVVMAADGVTPMTEKGIATALVTQKELKTGFDNRIVAGAVGTKNSMYVFRGPTVDQLYVCFEPSSAQFHRDAVTKCVSDAVAYGAASALICPAAPATNQLFCMP